MYTISFSSYGNREATVVSRFLKPAKYFKSGVDPEARAAAERAVNEQDGKTAELDEKLKALSDQRHELLRQGQEFKDQIVRRKALPAGPSDVRCRPHWSDRKTRSTKRLACIARCRSSSVRLCAGHAVALGTDISAGSARTALQRELDKGDSAAERERIEASLRQAAIKRMAETAKLKVRYMLRV